MAATPLKTAIFLMIQLVGLLLIIPVFVMIFSMYLAPTLLNTMVGTNVDATTQSFISTAFDYYIGAFKLIYPILFFIICVVFIATVVKRDTDDDITYDSGLPPPIYRGPPGE